jgi:hypothetical protein
VLNSNVVMVADATLLVANVKITSAHMACPFVFHFRRHWVSMWLDVPGRDFRARLGMMPKERRADKIIGPHVRRLAFVEMLPSRAHLIKSALSYRATGWRRHAGNMMWPMARRLMTRMYDIKPAAAAESRARLEAELDWLDAKLPVQPC